MESHKGLGSSRKAMLKERWCASPALFEWRLSRARAIPKALIVLQVEGDATVLLVKLKEAEIPPLDVSRIVRGNV